MIPTGVIYYIAEYGVGGGFESKFTKSQHINMRQDDVRVDFARTILKLHLLNGIITELRPISTQIKAYSCCQYINFQPHL